MEKNTCLKCSNLLKKIKDQNDIIKYYKERLDYAEKTLAQYKAGIDYQHGENPARQYNDGV